MERMMADGARVEDTPQDSQATSRTLMDAMLSDPLSERLWNRFQKRYRKIVYDWCVAKKLQPADADDVTQDVFRRLVAAMRGAQYDPARRFRAYLRGVVNHALSDYFGARGRRREIDGDGAAGVLDGAAAPPDELIKRLELAVDDELLDAAKSVVRAKLRNDGKQEWWSLYDVFLDTRLRRADFARTHAAAHHLSVDAAQQRLTRVTRMIREQYERLAGPEE